MSVKNFVVRQVSRNDIKDFIETYHYSKSINGCISDYCFALFNGENMIGAMFYGRMAMRNQYRKFASCEDDVIELRRLCCIDETPKNTESYFIGKSLRMLYKVWKGKVVVSYADKEYGHSGIIYKASNFQQLKDTPKMRVITDDTGRIWHDKSIRTKYKGILKPFAQKLRDRLEKGECYYKETKGKHTYIYKLR